MAESRDVVIIGAGHNGLITAFYLAKAGFKPLILERRPQVGGCAITEEFHPGFRCSTLAHSTGPIRPEIVADMKLESHGLKYLHARGARAVAVSHGASACPVFRWRADAAGDREVLDQRSRQLFGIPEGAGQHCRSRRSVDEDDAAGHRRSGVEQCLGLAEDGPQNSWSRTTRTFIDCYAGLPWPLPTW